MINEEILKVDTTVEQAIAASLTAKTKEVEPVAKVTTTKTKATKATA